jgi:hypothetical protein
MAYFSYILVERGHGDPNWDFDVPKLDFGLEPMRVLR